MLSRILTGAAGAAAASWTCGAPRAAPAPPAAEDPDSGSGQAAARLAEVERRGQQRAREAREAGFREGEAAGRAQAEARWQAAADELALSLAALAGLRPRLMREAGAELVELALGIARRVLRRELTVDPGALEALVQAALGKLPARDIRGVRVHPELEDAVRRGLARAGRADLALAADATLAPGALLVETTRGHLDASLETQLAEIGRGLADRIGEN